MPAQSDPSSDFGPLFLNHPRPMWVYDFETLAFLAVNDAALATYGYSREEFLRLTIADIRPPADRARLADYLARVSAAGARTAGRWRHQRRDGGVLIVEVASSEVCWNGRPARLVSATDVSEHARIETGFRKLVDDLGLERARLQTLVQHLPVMVALMGTDGRLLWANRCFEDTLGWSYEELRDRSDVMTLLCEPAEVERMRESMREATGEWVESDTRARTGGVHPILWAFVRLPDGTSVGIGKDLSEQRRDEERLRSIVAAMTEGVALVDRDGIVTFVNPAAEAMLGAPGAVEGRRYDDPAWPMCWLDGSPVAPEERIFPRVMREGAPVLGVEYAVHRADGTSLVVSFGGVPLRDHEGEITGMVASLVDVTELRRTTEALKVSEERFRALTEHAADATAVVDARGRVLYGSPAARRMLGYEAGELLDSDIFELVHPADLAAVQASLRSVLEKPDVSVSIEVRLRNRDGSWILNRGTLRNLLDHPAVGGIVINARDVTEARHLEQQLLQAQKMEAVGRLAGGVAHDFNNLLTSIQGHADFLLNDVDPADPLHGDVQEIMRAAERATALTRQLLAFSRKQVLQPRVLDLGEVLGGMERLLVRLIGEDVELRIAVEERLGAVRADAGQLEQVILNMAVNARDAMPTGGTITIGVANARAVEARVDADGGGEGERGDAGVAMTISDTGSGMPPEVTERIFEPFFTTKESGKGTGLGLSTVYGIVQQSGGHVHVDSEVGVGTTFRIWLPRVDEAPDSPARPAPRLAPLVGRGEKILLVEDEDGVRSLARRTLTRLGYRVLEARNAGEALLTCERLEGPLELILTDVVMPQMSGRELVDRLREVRDDFRVLFMSGYTDDRIVQHGVASGQDRLLEKPFTPDALGRAVRDTLDGPRPASRPRSGG
jgi:PAS domain S-box-containing protein